MSSNTSSDTEHDTDAAQLAKRLKIPQSEAERLRENMETDG